MDIWTTAHKNNPFVDNKTYPAMCFTCYHTPKISEQKYARDGSVLEDASLPYSCENLCTAKELHESGAADSVRQARVCLEAVQNLCKGVRPDKKPKTRPSASWNVG